MEDAFFGSQKFLHLVIGCAGFFFFGKVHQTIISPHTLFKFLSSQSFGQDKKNIVVIRIC